MTIDRHDAERLDTRDETLRRPPVGAVGAVAAAVAAAALAAPGAASLASSIPSALATALASAFTSALSVASKCATVPSSGAFCAATFCAAATASDQLVRSTVWRQCAYGYRPRHWPNRPWHCGDPHLLPICWHEPIRRIGMATCRLSGCYPYSRGGCYCCLVYHDAQWSEIPHRQR